MIQNNLLSSQNKFYRNQIKNTEVKKIHYLTGLVGQLGRPLQTYTMLFFAQCYPPQQI